MSLFLPRTLRKVEALPRNETGKLPRDQLLALLRDWPAQSTVLPLVGPRAMTQGELIDALRAAGLPIRDIAVETPDLEDVFVQMTARR